GAPTSWWNGPQPPGIAVTDTPIDPPPGNSGVSSITYSATGAGAFPQKSVQASSFTATLTAEGTTTYAAQATDRSGNVENPASHFTVNYDHTAPTAAAGITSTGPTHQPNNKGWYSADNDATSATISASDATSGMAALCWTLRSNVSVPVGAVVDFGCATDVLAGPGTPVSTEAPIPE